MPMSCSSAAAHSSSRSTASPSWTSAAASSSKRPRARRATWAVCGLCSGSMPYCAARLTTLAWRTSSNSGGSPPRWCSKNTPSRRPASGTSIPSKPPTSMTVCTTIAPPRMMSPREGLIPGNLARSAGGGGGRSSARGGGGALGRRGRGQLVDQAVELLARDDVALDAGLGHLEVALRRGGEVADRPPDADQARAAAAQPRRALELGRDVADELADLLGLGRPV